MGGIILTSYVASLNIHGVVCGHGHLGDYLVEPFGNGLYATVF